MSLVVPTKYSLQVSIFLSKKKTYWTGLPSLVLNNKNHCRVLKLGSGFFVGKGCNMLAPQFIIIPVPLHEHFFKIINLRIPIVKYYRRLS